MLGYGRIRGSKFGLRKGGQEMYPSFFADTRLDRRYLRAISRTLGDLPSGSKLQFFTSPKGSLGGITPLAALQRGMRAAVMRSAKGFAER